MTNALFEFDIESRVVRGLLLPFGELSRPSASKTEPVMFSAGTVDLPADVSVVSANRSHSQFEPVGRAIEITETERGIEAAFEIAKTPEGDQHLLDLAAGKFRALSAEIKNLVRDGSTVIKAALTGAAFVPVGAFESAAVFALAEDELAAVLEDEGFIARVAEAVAALTTPPTPEESTDSTETQETEEALVADAVAPEGLAPLAEDKKDKTSATGLFAALATARTTGDATALAEYKDGHALFAISTVQHSGPTTLTIGADTQVPQFINEIWTRRAYSRKYIPLGLQESLTSMKVNGWKWDPAAEPVVAAYAGNTAEIPSGAVDTVPVTADAVRLAGGHRLDRRFLDFGDQSVYQSYLTKMSESYARVSDNAWLTAAVAGATASNSSLASLPSGIVAGLGAIIDGAMAVIASENTPSFAVVNPTLWRNIALTGNKDVLGYLNASLGLESGSLDGFQLIPGAVAANKVLVGAKEAFTFYELPGVPIRVEGISPANGAIDPALFGYYATVVNNSAALQLVTCVA